MTDDKTMEWALSRIKHSAKERGLDPQAVCDIFSMGIVMWNGGERMEDESPTGDAEFGPMVFYPKKGKVISPVSRATFYDPLKS